MHHENVIAKRGLAANSYLSSIYPWIIWTLGACFFFYKYLVQVSPSVMTESLMKEFNVQAMGLGNLSSCYFYSYLLMQIPVGILLDKYSPRYLTTLAILTCGVFTFLFSETNSILLACLARALIGFGAAFSAISLFKLTSLWFPPNRFALVSGMCMTAAMLGAIFGQYPLSLLVQSFGWRNALQLIGCSGIILSLLYLLTVRDKTATSLPFDSTQTKNCSNQSTRFNFFSVLKNKQAWLLSLYSGLAFAPVSVFGGLWGVPFIVQAHHLTTPQAAFTTSFIFIGFALGAPLLGWLSDLIRRRKPIMLFGPLLALCTLTLVIYIPQQGVTLLSLLLFLFGFGASGFFTSFAMIREVFPVLLAATVLGFMNTFDSICEAITEPLIGALLDTKWQSRVSDGVHIFTTADYQYSLSFLLAYFIIALCLLFFINETYCEVKHDNEQVLSSIHH